MPPDASAVDARPIYRDDFRYCPATRYGQAHAPHGYRFSLDEVSGAYDCPGLTEAQAGNPYPVRSP